MLEHRADVQGQHGDQQLLRQQAVHRDEQVVQDALARLLADVKVEADDLTTRNDAAYTRIFRRPLERAFVRIERENSGHFGPWGSFRTKAFAIALEEVQNAIADGQTGGFAKPEPAQVVKSVNLWCDGKGTSPHPVALIASNDNQFSMICVGVVALLCTVAFAVRGGG